MEILEILQHTSHRAYPIPEGLWGMEQIWGNMLFAHWPVARERLLELIPSVLDLDLWEGRPWVSAVPFDMRLLKVRWMPKFPTVNQFLQLNFRTYVHYKGIPGVFFFGLDATSRLAVEGARLAGLPYYSANMSMQQERDGFTFYSKRKDSRGSPAWFHGWYRGEGQLQNSSPGTLLHWLSERYCLYTCHGKNRDVVRRTDIHHLPWKLEKAQLELSDLHLLEPLGLQKLEAQPLLCFAKQQHVCFWAPHRVDAQN